MKAILCDICGKIIENECITKNKSSVHIYRSFPRKWNKEPIVELEMDICVTCFDEIQKKRKAL